MKNTILLLLLLLVGALSEARAQGFRVGVKAGPTLSNFTNTNASSDYRVAAHAGLVASCPINERLSVQTELLFSMKGDQKQGVQGSTVHNNLSYLELPVLLKVNINGFFLEAGPQLGLLLTAKLKANELSIKTNDYHNSLDLGYAAGLGYQLEGGLNLGLRYTGGLRNVADNEVVQNIDLIAPLGGRNSAFQFYVGYLLPGL